MKFRVGDRVQTNFTCFISPQGLRGTVTGYVHIGYYMVEVILDDNDIYKYSYLETSLDLIAASSIKWQEVGF